MSLETDLQALIDRQAIVDLQHRLCHLIDTFQLRRIVDEIYAPNGSDDHGQGPVVGREAILAWYEDSTRNVAAIAHNVCNVMVELRGDKATMTSNVISWTWVMDRADGDIMHTADYALSIRYIDELTKYPEGWLIDSRLLVSNVSKTGYATIVALGTLPASQKGVQGLARKPPPSVPGQGGPEAGFD